MAGTTLRREIIKNSPGIRPVNFLTVLLNRNYVCPEMNIMLSSIAEELEKGKQNIQLGYLDANFPFLNKFPLLPHLSHNDGKKLDLALIYQTTKGEVTNLKKSRSGYGDFVQPNDEEHNQIQACFKKGYFQYDYPKYITLGVHNPDLEFSEKGTKLLIESVLKQKEVAKLFIEPHLKERLNLTDQRIRYQGCRAVRHDDHIHLQIK